MFRPYKVPPRGQIPELFMFHCIVGSHTDLFYLYISTFRGGKHKKVCTDILYVLI